MSRCTSARGLLLLWPVCMCLFLQPVHGHGRLWEPPSRSSMWRRGIASPANYQDMELFCGGFGVQYGQNGGKCGVCGDPWNGPRENEPGGKYANGIIVRKYSIGQVINITVQLTASHKGYFEFHLCPTDNPFEKVSHACLEQYPLKIAESGEIRYHIPQKESYSEQWFNIKARLPDGVKCRACVLQWKYNAGNSWGVFPDGTGCIGCGDQEQFYGCADIAIGHDDVILGIPAEKHPWYFEEKVTEWHYGIVRYNNSGSGGSTLRQSTPFNSCALMVVQILVFLLIFVNRYD